MNDPTLEQRYTTNKAVRGTFVKLTAVWGFVLLLEVSLKIFFIFFLPTDRFLVIAPIVTIIIIGVAVFWSITYVKGLKKRAH
ncbi:hypothetical protein HQN88_14290 [Paenibacillus qinlingensis]|nr:hypothetical protein [Paenibacillus qinlingensis]